MKRTHDEPMVRPVPGALLAVLSTLMAFEVLALPSGDQVVAGQVSIVRPGATAMRIQQDSASAIVNWQVFSIGTGERVDIRQPGAGSVILNRVVGNGRSDIHGRLTANGKVFLVNPNGVLIGPNAAVDVGSLVASSLPIDDQDFLAGRYVFDGQGGDVTNQGTISAADRGTVALLGGQVRNDGTISARLGTVALASGERIRLDLAGDGLSQLTVERGALDALVENGNAIIADGGHVLLSARAVETLARGVVNQTGIVRARSLTEREGRIVLDSGRGGTTLLAGRVDASGDAADTRGGEVRVLGENVGLIETATLNVSGPAGGGTALIGGDYQGANPDVPNARAAYVGRDVTVTADATDNGDGGKIIMLGDDAARAHGSLSARGGPNGGDGGLIETSGKYLDTAGVRVSTAALKGEAGEWLLDPVGITIVSGGTTANAGSAPNFESTTGPATVNDSDISEALLSSNVRVRTGDDGEGNGDLRVTTGVSIDYTGNEARTLTLEAHGSIFVEGDSEIIASGQGSLSIDMNADLDATGFGWIRFFDQDSGVVITTNGGGLRLYGQSDPLSGYAQGGSEGSGIRFDGALIDTGSGLVSMRGQASDFGNGVELFDTSISATSGTITVTGRGSLGIVSSNTRVSTSSGDVHLLGLGTDLGVGLSRASVQTDGGNIDVVGRGSLLGVGIFSNSELYSGNGQLSIAGETDGGSEPGLTIDGSSVLGVLSENIQEGDIILRASSTGPDAIQLCSINGSCDVATISTSGTLVFAPGSVSSSGSVSVANDVPIYFGVDDEGIEGFILEPDELLAIANVTNVVVGTSSHTGLIEIDFESYLEQLDGAATFNLTLQNEGNGSEGLQIWGDIELPGQRLTLATAGPIYANGTDSLFEGGLIADELLIRGTSATTVTLMGDNDVNRLAVDPPAIFSFVNSGSLAIGPVDFVGFDAASNTVFLESIDSTSSSIGDFFVQVLDGNFILLQDITTQNGDITLVAENLFLNIGNGSLNPGGGARWQVWARSWDGEERGGLVGSGPTPNYYGCIHGEGCPPGVTIPTTGNQFIYAERPAVNLVADDKTRRFGEPNPPLTFSATGLVNGDTAANAITATLTTTATRTSPVDSYPITFEEGWFSPVGYEIFQLIDGTLTVIPALEPVRPPDSTYVYDRNFGVPLMCMATGSVLSGSASRGDDVLALEWSRVRDRPNLSNCVELGVRNACSDF